MAKKVSFENIRNSRFSNYFNKGLILDTGPLLFLLGGYYNPSKIGETVLTKEYEYEEFEMLMRFLSSFSEVSITPQILAEVSNMVNNKLPKDKFKGFMEKAIIKLREYGEIYIEKDKILEREEAKTVGFTDISILASGKETGKLILTKDLSFSLICKGKGVPVVHFDELRFE